MQSKTFERNKITRTHVVVLFLNNKQDPKVEDVVDSKFVVAHSQPTLFPIISFLLQSLVPLMLVFELKIQLLFPLLIKHDRLYYFKKKLLVLIFNIFYFFFPIKTTVSTDTHETTQKKFFKKEKVATHPLAPACLHNFQNLTILPDSAELSKVPPTLPNYVPAKVNKNTFFHLLQCQVRT